MVPRLVTNDLFDGSSRIATRLRPDERASLLPVLMVADQKHAPERAQLRALICEGEPARSAAACQTAVPEDRTRLRNFLSESAAFLVGTLLYVLTSCFLWLRFRNDWPAITMSVIGSMATAASFTWFIVTEQMGPAGETGWVLVALALVAMPIVAVVSALLTWAVIRKVRHLALAWCLAQAIAFLVFTLPVMWKYAAL